MDERSFRRKVGWFQFICCLLVIWNHAGNAELFLGEVDLSHPLWVMENGVALSIVSFSIPCFLMLSGYLFYRNFTWKDLPGKWKRRVRTLLVPYLVWNLLYYLGFLMASRIPYVNEIVGRKNVPFSITGLLRAVLLFEFNPVFWFMFQLLLLTVLAPVLYLLMENAAVGVGWLALLLWGIYAGVELPWLNLDALTYYSVAAYAALHGRKAAEAGWDGYRGVLGAELVALGVVLSADYYFYGRIPFIVYCRCLVPLGLWLLTNERWLPERKPWMECTFFVYAFHFIPVRLFNKLAAAAFAGNAWAAAVAYLAVPVASYAVCWQTAKVLRRFAPKVWEVLSGGR